MAHLLRFGVIQALRKGSLSVPIKNLKLSSRYINTSSKPPQASQSSTIESCDDTTEQKPKTWISYGFSERDEALDRLATHVTFFTTISICLVLGSVIAAYLPDPRGREWAQREAYLQLRYREDHGLPPIDINYVDPSKIYIPEDHEIGDNEIII